MYHHNYFLVCKSVALSTFTTHSCADITTNHLQNSDHLAKRKLCLFSTTASPIFLFLQPLVSTSPLSVLWNLTSLNTTCGGTVFVSLWLAYFTVDHVCRAHHVVACVRILFLFKVKCYCIAMYTPQFLYLFIFQLKLECFHLFATVDNATMDVSVQIPLQVFAFNSLQTVYIKKWNC